MCNEWNISFIGILSYMDGETFIIAPEWENIANGGISGKFYIEPFGENSNNSNIDVFSLFKFK